MFSSSLHLWPEKKSRSLPTASLFFYSGDDALQI